MNISDIAADQRIAFETNAKMGVKTGTVKIIKGSLALVKFDLGYSRWVSVQKLEKLN